MRKLKLIWWILFLFTFTGCNTYYVASTNEAVDLYSDANGANIAYNVPVNTILLLKGNALNGYRKVRYHSNPNWYWVSYSNLTVVPGFNPKYYNETYSSFENNAEASSGGYDATIQTGSRGGKYYINKNGNKTYVKRSTISGSTRHVGGRGSRGGGRH